MWAKCKGCKWVVIGKYNPLYGGVPYGCACAQCNYAKKGERKCKSVVDADAR